MKLYINITFSVIYIIIMMWFIYRYFFISFRYQNIKGIRIKLINKMDLKEFENYLEEFFMAMDFNVKRADATFSNDTKFIIEKGTVRTAVQAKEVNTRIGTEDIEAAAADRIYYKCDNAMIISNSGFTRQAYILARAINVHLVNRRELIAVALKMKRT